MCSPRAFAYRPPRHPPVYALINIALRNNKNNLVPQVVGGWRSKKYVLEYNEVCLFLFNLLSVMSAVFDIGVCV